MVTGHARLGLFCEAVALFLAMVDDGAVVVNAVVAAAAFAASTDAGDLSLAGEVHQRILVGVALDMYPKCRNAVSALRCFRAMAPAKNVVTWNTVIPGPREALSLFWEMLEQQGVRRDDAMFIAVLASCALTRQVGARLHGQDNRGGHGLHERRLRHAERPGDEANFQNWASAPRRHAVAPCTRTTVAAMDFISGQYDMLRGPDEASFQNWVSAPRRHAAPPCTTSPPPLAAAVHPSELHARPAHA
jgi:hypothetical protein